MFQIVIMRILVFALDFDESSELRFQIVINPCHPMTVSVALCVWIVASDHLYPLGLMSVDNGSDCSLILLACKHEHIFAHHMKMMLCMFMTCGVVAQP